MKKDFFVIWIAEFGERRVEQCGEEEEAKDDGQLGVHNFWFLRLEFRKNVTILYRFFSFFSYFF